jgi:tetratricopeptide (TPR) repeat protein
LPDLPDADADRLAEALGDLPAALAQAAIHIHATGQDVDAYLRLSGSWENPYATALGITLDRLCTQDPDASDLLKLCSYLGQKVQLGQGIQGDEAPMHTLDRLELGRFDPETRALLVPRCVRETVRDTLTPEAAARTRERLHTMLSTPTGLVPPEILGSDERDVRAVVVDHVRFLYHSGEFEGCRALAEEAVARWRARYGDDDALMLDAAEVLTNVLYAKGRPKQTAEAGRLSEEILRGLRSVHGPNHPAILLTAGRLGGGQGLRYQGDFASACGLDDAIWRRTEQRYDTDHPNALHAAERAATDLYLLGRFHEAHERDAMVLDRLQPNDSADTLKATHHLARDLHALGRYEDALRHYEAVLEQALDVLGRDHALVLHAQRAHAGTLRKAGRLTDAARLADQTLDGHLRRFGTDHPATLAAKVTAALAGASAGAPGLGRVLAEEALEGYRRTLGEDHPFTNACAIDLAVIMRAVGDVQGALDLDRNALASLREGGRLGHDHFYSLCGAAGMANDLYLLDELQAAHGLMSRTLDGFLARHGPNHPYTLACIHDLAVIARASSTGRDGLRALLGEHHPEVRAAARDELLDCDIDLPPL